MCVCVFLFGMGIDDEEEGKYYSRRKGISADCDLFL